MRSTFRKLNTDWNAEPNVPEPRVTIADDDVLLEFFLNPFLHPRFTNGQRGHIRFSRAWRYRMGTVNDEGFLSGQCRFSSVAPEWGHFYEVSGDLKLPLCPSDWVQVAAPNEANARHFLFYLRDEEFECAAADWTFLPTTATTAASSG